MKGFGNSKRMGQGLCCVFLAFIGFLATAAERESVPMKITTPAFEEGKTIPAKYTCDGKDVSPPLKWTAVPVAAKTLALTVDDPDAPVGDWFHWILYNLPVSTTELPEALPKTENLPKGGRQGMNDFKRLGYSGPCPPSGKPHRYFFKLYALDVQLNLPANITGKEFLTALTNHIIAQTAIMGTYERK